MVYLNGLIFATLVFFVPLVFCFLLFIFKWKLSLIQNIYLYSFTTGLVLVLSTLGFLKESIDLLNHYFENDFNKFKNLIIILVIVSGLIIGFLIGGICKFIFFVISKRKCKNHQFLTENESCSFHNEEKFIIKNNKLVGAILLVGHKIIDGLSIGFLLNESQNELFKIENIGLIIGFIIHIIPTTIILYYIYCDIIESQLKSFLWSSFSNLIIIPFIFLGILITTLIQNIYWLIPLLLTIAGGVLLFTSIFELAPEFIHNNHLCSHKWFFTFLWFAIGVILSIILTSIHSHIH